MYDWILAMIYVFSTLLRSPKKTDYTEEV